MTVLAIDRVQLGFPQGSESLLRHFYGQVLELREIREPGTGTLQFDAGGQRVELVPIPPFALPSWSGHLALRVRNLPGLRSRLRAEGYSIDESRPLPGHLRFYVRDPADNLLEVLEPAPLTA